MLFSLLSAVASLKSPIHIDVGIDVVSVLHEVAPNFLGVNIDSASLYKDERPGLQKDRLNFRNPSLNHVAKVFAAAGGDSPRTPLRIGGGSAESQGFEDHAQEIVVDEAYWNDIADFVVNAGFELVWDLNSMGTNQNLRYRDAKGKSVWNSTNAEKFLRHVAQSPRQTQMLASLQLGNEPGHYLSETPGAPSPQEHAADFVKLRQIIHDIFVLNDTLKSVPKLQGPDVCFGLGHMGPTGFDKCANLTYFRDLLHAATDGGGTSVLDEVSVHHYGLKGPNSHNATDTQCFLRAFLQPTSWEADVRAILQSWVTVQRQAAPAARLILSETATTGDGGCVGLSNTFAAGFYWVDQLATAMDLGYWQVYRQDLVGWSGITLASSYALAGDPGWAGASNAEAELVPNPDFYTSLLWKRLMGSKALSANVTYAQLPSVPSSANDGYPGYADLGAATAPHAAAAHVAPKLRVRVFAACTRRSGDGSDSGEQSVPTGSVTLAFLNGEDSNVTLCTSLGSGASRGSGRSLFPRDEYRLEAGSTIEGGTAKNLTSRLLSLNGGAPLTISSSLEPHHVAAPTPATASNGDCGDSDSVDLGAYSYGFIVLLGANAEACM